MRLKVTIYCTVRGPQAKPVKWVVEFACQQHLQFTISSTVYNNDSKTGYPRHAPVQWEKHPSFYERGALILHIWVRSSTQIIDFVWLSPAVQVVLLEYDCIVDVRNFAFFIAPDFYGVFDHKSD